MSVLLTARQVQVLELLADGLDGSEIAEHLGISVHTVYTHRRMLQEKLGAHNAANAVHLGHKSGYLRGGAR